MAESADVIVIGAGIIGAACAWRLSQAGMSVTVLERNAPGSEASQAALGVLNFHSDPEKPTGFQALSSLSREIYPGMVQELTDLTGDHVGYRADGELIVAPKEDDLATIESAYAMNLKLGIPVERATPGECRLFEPYINPDICGAIFFPDDARVDNTALTFALVRAAEQEGVVFHRTNVEAIESIPGQPIDVRCAGETFSGDWTVVAAGCWSGQIKGVPPLPVTPARGQAFSVVGPSMRRVIASPRVHVVPKRDGQTQIGSTVEYVGFEASSTLGALQKNATASFEISPVLADCEFLAVWAGLRPATPDELPYIGPFGERPNLIAATGHYRNGILLAPITAALVTAVVTGEVPPLDLTAFLPDRVVP